MQNLKWKNIVIPFFEASLSQLSIHKLGNKLLDENVSLSEHPIKTDDEILDGLLINFFSKPFKKINEKYRLSHPSDDLNLNEVFPFAKSIFKDKNDTSVDDSILISDSAVKKQDGAFKSVLKLDKNFHIYIHVNKELIEKVYDEKMKMNYYKVYFREEA